MVRATKILSVCLSVIAIYTNNVLFFFRKHKHSVFVFFSCFLRGSHTNAHPTTHALAACEGTGGFLISSSSQYTVNKINSIFTIKYLAG